MKNMKGKRGKIKTNGSSKALINTIKEKNFDVFGDDIKNHGHNYVLRITIQGSIDSSSGFLINLQWLNRIIKEEILSILDHAQIDQDIDWFQGKSPSTENLVVFIWEKLEPYFSDKNSSLYKVFLRETPTIYTEYYGPKSEENS